MKNRGLTFIGVFLLAGFLFCCSISSVSAQTNDAGLWASVNLDKKITKRIQLNFSEELRFNENISELGTAFSEFGAEYKLNKHFSVAGAYRFIQKRNLDDSYSLRHRMIGDFNVKDKIHKIALSLRLRFQSQYSDYESSADGAVPDNYLRTKLTVKYDLDKRYTPFASSELFFQLNNPAGNEMDNLRITGGVEYEFTKKTSVDVFYLFNKEYHVNDPWTSYIIGVAFNHSF